MKKQVRGVKVAAMDGSPQEHTGPPIPSRESVAARELVVNASHGVRDRQGGDRFTGRVCRRCTGEACVGLLFDPPIEHRKHD